MSDYHILKGTGTGSSYSVVFHVGVPDEVLPKSTENLRAVLAGDDTEHYGDEQNPKASRLPVAGIGAIQVAEQTQLTDGELFEHFENFKTNPVHSALQDQARLDARFTELVTEVPDELRKKYAYFGIERSVA